jgi:uncharacterized protein YqhQ
MNILGGNTNGNSITYYSDHYIATSTLNAATGEISTVYKKHNIDTKNILYKIPLIRGLVLDIMTNIWETLIFILGYFILKNPDINYLYLGYIFVSIIKVHFNDMNKLHGAEHKVFNAYESNIDLTDIKRIKECSIVNKKCGTTSYFINLFILYGSWLFIDNFLIRYFLMTALVKSMKIRILKDVLV